MIKLREFSLSDLDQIFGIEGVSFSKREVFSCSLFDFFYHKYPQGFIVAENEKKIIGYTIGQLRNNCGEIVSLAVDPGWRQRGIGTKLTNFLIDRFKEKNVKEIFLHVRTGNESAISFYKNVGFKILKTIKNYYQNSDDAFLMKKGIKNRSLRSL